MYQIFWEHLWYLLTLFRMDLLGTADGWEGDKKAPFPKTSHISYNHEILLLIPYLKKTQKHMNPVTYSLSSADISIFSLEIKKLCYIKDYRNRLHFDAWFLILSTFFEFLKIFLIKIVTVLMISANVFLK